MRNHASGFSLLELLVVLTLLGVITGLSLPALDRLYNSIRLSTERDYILDQIAGMGEFATGQQQGVVLFGTATESRSQQSDALALAAYQPYEIDLPPGWRIAVAEPVIARASGVCLGGEVTLFHEEQQQGRLTLEAPYCHVR